MTTLKGFIEDLVAGSGFTFGDAGGHELKGRPRPLAPLPGGERAHLKGYIAGGQRHDQTFLDADGPPWMGPGGTQFGTQSQLRA
jgi:hypothetical protein